MLADDFREDKTRYHVEAPFPDTAVPALPHLLRLHEKVFPDRLSHRDPDGELVLDRSRFEVGPALAWTMYLPWEQTPLSGNSRENRWDRSRKVRMIRETAMYLALRQIPHQTRIRVRLDMHPVIRRTRDEDNLWPTMKALVDGLRLGMVIDDDSKKFCVRETPEILYRPKSADNPVGYHLLHIQPEPV